MATKVKETEQAIEHPMEETLDIESGSTLLPQLERETDLTPADTYDEKDNEIEDNFQEVYDSAMTGYETQVREVELAEGRYKARNGEIAVSYLNTALSAAREKLNLKQHRDKIEISKAKANAPGTVNQNLIVSDRNELLKILENNKNSDDEDK